MMKKTWIKLVLVSVGFVALTLVYSYFSDIFAFAKIDGIHNNFITRYMLSVLLSIPNSFIYMLITAVYTAGLYMVAREGRRWFLTMLLNTVIVMAATLPIAVYLAFSDMVFLEGLVYIRTMVFCGLFSMVLSCAVKVVSVILAKQTNKGVA
jgi:hypothetical protein